MLSCSVFCLGHAFRLGQRDCPLASCLLQQVDRVSSLSQSLLGLVQLVLLPKQELYILRLLNRLFEDGCWSTNSKVTVFSRPAHLLFWGNCLNQVGLAVVRFLTGELQSLSVLNLSLRRISSPSTHVATVVAGSLAACFLCHFAGVELHLFAVVSVLL